MVDGIVMNSGEKICRLIGSRGDRKGGAEGAKINSSWLCAGPELDRQECAMKK